MNTFIGRVSARDRKLTFAHIRGLPCGMNLVGGGSSCSSFLSDGGVDVCAGPGGGRTACQIVPSFATHLPLLSIICWINEPRRRIKLRVPSAPLPLTSARLFLMVLLPFRTLPFCVAMSFFFPFAGMGAEAVAY